LSLAHSAWPDAPAPMQFYKVVFDERFAASRAFAAEVQRLGLPVHGIRGDVTSLWYDDLYARWKQSPAAIAGLTQKAPLFCLDLLARDQRMRLAYLGEHVRRSESHVEHALSGPRKFVGQARLAESGPEWTSRLANLMSRFPENWLQAAPVIVAPLAGPGDPPEHLVSWVIAPRRAV